MPKPNNPNTAAATAAVIRRGQETMARKLRDAGWMAIPPEQLAPPAWATSGRPPSKLEIPADREMDPLPLPE